MTQNLVEDESCAAGVSAVGAASRRVVALDALRGFDMFWIVGGQQLALAIAGLFHEPVPAWVGYQLEHAEWIGFTAWDLIMPLFLFVVGAAMPFAFERRIERGQTKAELYLKIVRRTLILFVLGMIVQGHLLDFNLSTLHLYCNTLQAIAAGYVIAGVLMLNIGIWGQAIFTALMLVGYWLLLVYVPVPGHGVGVLEPGANLALAVDEAILGRFRDGTPYTWILSSMTFTATVLLGVMAGHVLQSMRSPIFKFIAMATMGLACLAGGWAWANWLGLPIIKHIWTSSMVLWAAGWSYLLLALFYLLIDIVGWRRWAFPFVVIGLNAITIYVASFFVPFHGVAEALVGGLARHLGAGGPVLIAFSSVLLMWLVLYHLYRQRIFLRI
jgi:predicted acyltransferase